MNLATLMTAPQDEIARQMSVCNACRYCEGLCAVFPAMERRRVFEAGDVDYLANLCHNCGACYFDCQYAPPHPFAINVPSAMATLREESYARYAWPAAAAPMLERNGPAIAGALVAGVALFILGFVLAADPGALFASGTEPGAFYRVMPHNAMVAVFGGAFAFGVFATAMGVRRFWRETGGGPISAPDLWRALRDGSRLRYLDGGGMGCMTESERPDDRRKLFHHLTYYGFLLCFASTSTGTVFHYLLDWPAPYPWWTPVKVFGVLGGIGLTVGAAGLLRERGRRHGALRSGGDGGLGAAFIWVLLLLGSMGLALTALRATPAMGVLLAVHLGVVFAFFVTMPYGKFVHGLYRMAALTRHAHETRGEADI